MDSRKIKVLLLEDNEEDKKEIKTVLEKNNYEISSATNLKEALKLFNSSSFDIAIIDIFINNQPEGGILASTINTSLNYIPFLFLTSSIDKRIFDEIKLTQPYNYLIKPFNEYELLYAIELTIEKFTSEKSSFQDENSTYYNHTFFIKEGGTITKVPYENINYIKVEGIYCKIVTIHGNFIVQSSLGKIYEDLSESHFIQTHRNYLINTKKIKNIFPEDNLILLNNDEKILLSKRYKSDLLRKIKVYK